MGENEKDVGDRETTPLVSPSKNVKNDYQNVASNSSPKIYHQQSSPKPKYQSLDFDRIVNEYSTASALARNKHIFQQRVRTQTRRQDQDSTSDDDYDDDKDSNPHQRLHRLESSTEQSKKVKLSNRGFTLTRWYLTMLVGTSTGLTAAFVLYFVEQLIEFRVGRLNRELQFLEDPDYDDDDIHIHWYDTAARRLGTPGVYLGYMLFNLLLVSISTCLCEILAPQAVSSGIPEVMSYGNGVQVGHFDSFKLFSVKLVATIFSVSSGLVIGPEGPVVHMGSILGACSTKLGDIEWSLRKFRDRRPDLAKRFGCANVNVKKDDTLRLRHTWVSKIAFFLSHFRNDLERRNLISVGAAAGFAAAFGAPVGGLLYSMEEASSFFDHAMLWKTLVGTCLATSIIAIYHGDFTKYSMLSLEIQVQEKNMMARFGEVPLYIVMGILGGVLGGTFNNLYHFVNHKRKHFYGHLSSAYKTRRPYVACKLVESGFVSLLTSAIMLTAPLQASWTCKEEPEMLDEQANAESYVHRYNCPPGYANEMGSILFGSREASIKDILTDPETFEPGTLLTVALIFLGLMILTFGTSVPSGMFMPTVLTGACLGGYAGQEFQRHVISSVHPSDFALIGAAAFLSGMQRNVVSLCVILMEGTGQTKVIIPIIITIVCARSVGDLFSDGIYEIGIELKGYPYLHHGEKIICDGFRAEDVMKTEFHSINQVESVDSLVTLLQRSYDQAFPVVSDIERQYLGMIRRDQIIAVLRCKIYLETLQDGSDINGNKQSSSSGVSDAESGMNLPEEDEAQERVAPETLSPWLRDNICAVQTSKGTKLLYGLDGTLPGGSTFGDRTIVKDSEGRHVVIVPNEDKHQHVDIGSLMNKAVFSVGKETPLSKTCNAFATLGLRHLPVLTPGGIVAGMITREELSEDHITSRMGKKLK